MEPAIRVQGLSKEYRLGANLAAGGTLYDALSRTLRSRKKGPSETAEPIIQKRFWALKDLSFELPRGEVLGVVGRNGAGKSTLLKILARITEPTRGRIEIRGRVASLLEVGTGFHPELSGRENIYLNGAILGMTRSEIALKFDEIVAFADVESFLETPVKRYSSGMYVRLAFAVAAHLEPDVLLVDEVLAVGDAEFQARCLGKMEQVASTGRTVVFVSHNNTAVRRLCTKCLLLIGGALSDLGETDEVLRRYSSGPGKIATEIRLEPPPGNPSWAISRVAARPAAGELGDRLSGCVPTIIEVDVRSNQAANLDVFLHCYDDQGSMVFSSGSFFDSAIPADLLQPGIHRYSCEIPANLLNDGLYSLDTLLVRNRHEVVSTEGSVFSFRIEDDFPPVPGWHWRPAGSTRPKLRWRRTPQESDGSRGSQA